MADKGGSSFTVHTPALAEHAARTDQRAKEVRRNAHAIGSTSMSGNALSSLAGSTVESISAATQRASRAASGMADRLNETADNERTTANRYDEVETSNAQRFRTIDEKLAGPDGNGMRGGPSPNGPSGGPATGDESWEGENGLYLSPEENAAARRFLDRAKQAESQITPVVQDTAHDTGSELLGYPDYVLKSPESFKRKFATTLARRPTRNIDKALATMKDSVRYTMRLPPEGTAYTDGVNATVQRFTAAGFEPVKFTNMWGSPGYQGINSFWRDPTTGHIFEMQFHTQESFNAKMDTHELYEQARLPGVSEERIQELEEQQNQIFNAVPRPHGASSIIPPE